MDWNRVIAVVLVVALAGCSLPGGEPTETVTPVDVGSADPPGVSTRTDSVNTTQLLDAHEGALDDRSYELQVNRIERSQGTRQGRLTAVGEFGADEGSYRLEIENSGNLTVFDWIRWAEYWAGDGRSLSARRVGDNLRVRETLRARDRLPIPPTRRTRLAGAIRTTNVTSVEETSSGVRIESSADLANSSISEPLTGLRGRNASLVLRVAESGLIRSYELSYTLSGSPGTAIRVHESGRFDGLDDTRVSRPDWVDRELSGGVE